jgi:hypothetical protein
VTSYDRITKDSKQTQGQVGIGGRRLCIVIAGLTGERLDIQASTVHTRIAVVEPRIPIRNGYRNLQQREKESCRAKKSEAVFPSPDEKVACRKNAIILHARGSVQQQQTYHAHETAIPQG